MTASRGALVLAAALVVVVAALAVIAGLRTPLPLPVVAHLGGRTVRIAVVQATVAVLVPPLLVAVVAALHGTGRLERSVAVWASGAAAPVVVFLVALLNGLDEAAALVLLYAAAGGGVLLRSLHRPGSSPLPLRLWAVLGVVPWGVVAFTQIGGLLVGAPPSVAVRGLTVVVLAASVVEFVVALRHRDVLPAPLGLLLVALPGVLLAALTIVLVD